MKYCVVEKFREDIPEGNLRHCVLTQDGWLYLRHYRFLHGDDYSKGIEWFESKDVAQAMCNPHYNDQVVDEDGLRLLAMEDEMS